jgi:hypothetical protein
MSNTTEQSEERRQNRRVAVGGRVRWNNVDQPDGCWAWLSDAGPSSIAFITRTDALAMMNDEIELTGPNAPTGRLRVARIAPYDDALSLVAAKIAPTPTAPRPHRWDA